VSYSSSNKGQPTVNGNDLKTYVPGQQLNLGSGITYEDWQNYNKYASVVVSEDTFLLDSDASGEAILLFNYSGQDLAVSLALPPKNRQGSSGDSRVNTVELECLDLLHGEGGHFNVSRSSTLLHLSVSVPNTKSQPIYLTGAGWPFSDLANQAITIRPNPQLDGVPTISSITAELGGRCTIWNTSSYDIKAEVKRVAGLSDSDQTQISMEKKSRKPDFGSQPIVSRLIPSKAKYEFVPPRDLYVVRGMLTQAEQEADPTENFFSNISNTPTSDDFVGFPDATITTSPNHAVGFFVDASGEGVVAYSVAVSDVKLCASNIAATE